MRLTLPDLTGGDQKKSEDTVMETRPGPGGACSGEAIEPLATANGVDERWSPWVRLPQDSAKPVPIRSGGDTRQTTC